MQKAPQARCPWSVLAWPLCPRYLRDCALLRLARAPSVGSLNAWGLRSAAARSTAALQSCGLCAASRQLAQKARMQRISGPARTVLLPESLWVAPSAAPVALAVANGTLSRRAQRLCATPRGYVNAEKFCVRHGQRGVGLAGIGLRGSTGAMHRAGKKRGRFGAAARCGTNRERAIRAGGQCT